jgi:hypothetical protein
MEKSFAIIRFLPLVNSWAQVRSQCSSAKAALKKCFCGTGCKELPNKDHTMCRKEKFIKAQTAGLSLSGSECSSLAGMGKGLYRRGHMVREGWCSREQLGHWPPFICDHQMEWVDMHSWLRNWKFLRFCKQGNKQESFASSHKSGGLVLVLASGPSAHPKNARDPTFQPFVGIMGTNRSICFLLSGGIIKRGEIWLEFGNL